MAGAASPTDRLVTGAEYERQLTARRSDRLARVAFRRLVLQLAEPGARLFDFGCGTGMDARFYAARGFSVSAYDVDPRMCDYFRAKCHRLVQQRRVVLEGGSYEEFVRRRQSDAEGRIDLVTANFAPLNLVADLHSLFARFHSLTAPHGYVLASVLSPYYAGDLKYRWWWHHLPALLRAGSYAVPGAQAPILRRTLADYSRQCLPYFRLRQVFRGWPAGRGTRTPPRALSPAGPAWLSLATCRFMFLLFDRP